MAGIYIHIPFCRQNCHYCDFYFSLSLHYKARLIDALKQEIFLRRNYLKEEVVETIYFGGGTPSVLSVNELESIMYTIKNNFKLSDRVEVTVEANPDDIHKAYVKGLKKIGVNRLSLGVQSFNNEDLRLMNRRHDSAKSEETLEILRSSGILNYSIDLMYAVPGSSFEILKRNLEKILDSETPHVSVYHLTYEEGTIFKHKLKKQRLKETGEEESILQYDLIRNMLVGNGYIHYEISNFAKKGFYSKHNTSYWFGKKYLGIGPSAHSYNGSSRQWNVSELQKYMEGVGEGSPITQNEILDEKTKYNEYIMVRLRTMWGVDHNELEKIFGRQRLSYFLKTSENFVAKGYLIRNQTTTKLQPGKFILSDYIIAELFDEQ